MSLPQNDTLPIHRRACDSDQGAKESTVCAALTGPGRAAIAVIGIRGPLAERAIDECFRPASPSPIRDGQIRYGRWQSVSDAAGESIVLLRIAPQHYEIHCHGGKAAVEQMLSDLNRHDIPSTSPDRFLNESDEQLIREAKGVLIRCTTEKTASIALDQVRGALLRWRNDSLKRIQRQPSAARHIATQAAEIARRGRYGTKLVDPWNVILLGPPNVGKSSLINAMVGYDRSITMDFPGTTRDVLDVETVFDGWPLRLRDTAGIRAADSEIEQAGVRLAWEAMRNADLAVLVSEPNPVQRSSSRLRIAREIPQTVTTLHVLNKSDLVDSQSDAEYGTSILRTVAVDGTGVETLLKSIVATLVGENQVAGAPVPVNQRQIDWLTSISEQADDPDGMLSSLTLS